MGMLGGRLALRFGIKRANAFGTLFGASVASLVAAGVVLAAITVSNILTFGPVQVGPPLGPAVTLTEIEGLPASITTDEKIEVSFRIEATQAVSDATIWIKLSADGESLDDSVVEIEYKHAGGSSKSVTLTLGGDLIGELKSGWDIPDGYDETGEIEIIFESDAPDASYQLDLWVEGTLESASNAASSSTQYQVEATAAETFSPESLTVSVGDGVEWTSVGSKAHTVTFLDPALPSRDYLPSGDTFYVTFDQAGTFNYVCEFHDGMVGTIIVQE